MIEQVQTERYKTPRLVESSENVLGTIKALSCAWMAGKKEVSAVAAKALKSFSRYFRCLTASPGRAVGVPELEGSGWPRYIRTPLAGSPRLHIAVPDLHSPT